MSDLRFVGSLVRFLSENIRLEILKALASRAGGEVVSADAY